MPPDQGQGAGHGMALGLRHLALEARQPGPPLMLEVVASFLCCFHEKVDRTAAFTCGAHMDEARVVVGHLQLQRADWCNALFCRPLRYSWLAGKTTSGRALEGAPASLTHRLVALAPRPLFRPLLQGWRAVDAPTTPGVQGP